MITDRISGLHSVLLPLLIQWYYIQLYTYVIIPLCWWPKRILCIHSETFLILRQICLPYFAFAEVKKQAEMADNLQTRHGRRLVHSYFHLWTDKTRQMQRARKFRDQTLLKRYANIWITLRERQDTWTELLNCPKSSTLSKNFAKLICLSFLQIAGRLEESYQEKAWWKKDYKVISRSTDEQEGETKCPFLSPPNTTFDVSLSSFEHLCSLLNFEHSNDACFNNRSHTV